MHPPRPAGFSLSLSHGTGQLVLTDRNIADRFVVEALSISLPRLPNRLDLSAGVEIFRHQRCRLDRLAVHLDEGALTRALGAVDGLTDLEVRIGDDEIAIAGGVIGAQTHSTQQSAVPFLCRLRLATASLAAERMVLISAWQTRVFGPSPLTGPQVAGRLLAAVGLGDTRRGPTVASVDPVDASVLEICAELGWKAPERRGVRLESIRCVAGRVQCIAARPSREDVGPQGVITHTDADGLKSRWFLADYEAKGLFAAIEAHIAAGALDVAAGAYQRQLEIHPGHPFIIRRLLQLYVAVPALRAEGLHLAQSRLARHPDDTEALLALAILRWRQSDGDGAAEGLESVARQLEAAGDALGAAQARCALAMALGDSNPVGAIAAFESALAQRRRLPMALRALATLYAQVGDRAAALRTRERLVGIAPTAAARRMALLDLGRLAHDDVEVARRAFDRLLRSDPDDIDALRGLAQVAEPMVAMRALDRAARVLQARGEANAAAEVITELGDVWLRQDDGLDAAILRYRQAQMLSPEAVGALVGLAEVAARQGHRKEARDRLTDVLALAARAPGRVPDPVAIHLRLGRLLAEDGDAAQAVVHLQRALSGRPEQVDAALDLLAGVYDAADRPDDLARVLALAAARAETPGERGRRLMRLATLVADRLGDGERAVRLLREASHLRPQDARIFERLATLLRQQDQPAALEAVLAQHTTRLTDPGQLASVHVERADLLFRRLNRADEAAIAYGLALGCAPQNTDALRGLAEIYRGQERAVELVGVLRRLAPLEDGRAALMLWLEAGRLARGLGRSDEALQAFEAALALDGEDTEALRFAGDLHFDAERFEAAMLRYHQLATLYEDDGYDEAPTPFLQRLAATHVALGQHTEALAMLQAAARLDPEVISTYEQAQDLLLRAGDVRGIVTFFESGLAHAESPRTRALLARRAGRLLWRELREPDAAAPLLDEAIAADAADLDVLRIRQEVATALGDEATVRRALQLQIEAVPSTRRPALQIRLAQLLFDAGEEAPAKMLVDAVLHARPDYSAAVDMRARWQDTLTQDSGRPGRALDSSTLTPAVGLVAPPRMALMGSVPPASAPPPLPERQLSPPPERLLPPAPEPEATADADVPSIELMSLASISQAPLPDMLSDSGLSIDVSQDSAPAIRGAPTDGAPPPLPQAQRAEPTAEDALGQLLMVAESAQTSAAWLAVAEFRRDVLRQPDAAVPDFERAIQGGTPDDDAWHEAVEALEDLHSLRGDQDALLGVYAMREAAGDGDPVQLALLRAAALRASDRMPDALAAAETALPDVRAVELVVELLSALGRHTDAAEHLLADLGGLSAQDALNRRWLAAEHLTDSDPARALQIYATAWAATPDALLLEDWLALARTQNDPAALQAVHLARAEAEPEGPPRSRAFADAATAARRRPEGIHDACALFEKAVAEWPENMDALESLGDALRLAERYPQLADNLDQQLAAALPGPWRGALAIRLAEIALDRLDDSDRAFAALELAMEEAPDDPGLPALRSRLRPSVAPAPEPDAPHIDVLSDAPAEPPEASKTATLEVVTPPPPPSMEVLAAESVEQVRSTPPPDRLDPALIQLGRDGNWRGVADGLGQRANSAASAEQADMLLRQSELLETQLNAPGEALEVLRALLTQDDLGVRALTQTVQRVARLDPPAVPALQELLTARLKRSSGSRARAALLAVRGELTRQYLSNSDRARADFQAAAAEAPGAALAAAGLGAIAVDARAERTALAWLQVALHAGPAGPAPLSPRQEVAAFERLDTVLHGLGRQGDLPALAGAILDANPGCGPALAVVDTALSGANQWDALVLRIDAACHALVDPPLHLLWRKAELLAGPLRQRPASASVVDAVLERDPQHAAARRLALALAGEREAWSDYVAHGEALLAHSAAQPGQPDVLRLAIARVHADLLAQPHPALAHLQHLHATQALTVDAVGLFIQTARAASDAAVLTTALRAQAELDPQPTHWLSLAEHLLATDDIDGAIAARAQVDPRRETLLDPAIRARLQALDAALG